MTKTPLISVLVPVFNSGVRLRSTLESLREQTCPDFEVLLADDGSTDGSLEILREFAARDSRFQVEVGDGNQGIPATRNRTLARARGEYLAWLNHDDLSLPHRFECQLEYLRTHPEIGVLGCTREVVDGEGRLLRRVPLPSTHLGLVWKGLLDCPLIHSGTMARREPIRRHGLRYDLQFPVHSDFDFFVRLLRVTQGATLPEVLFRYRFHEANTSKLRRQEMEDTGHKIAFANIRHELPEVPVTETEVAHIRGVYTDCRTVVVKELKAVKTAWERLHELRDAFRSKYAGHPQLDRVEFP